jgi:hypothetical protein
LVTEFWEKNEWHMCLTCKRERAKLYARIRQKDPEYRKANVERSRRYRLWVRENCPQYLNAYDRERKARNRVAARERRQQERLSA